MSMLSLAYMIHQLFGENEPADFQPVIGKTISAAAIVGEEKGAWWEPEYSYYTNTPIAGVEGKLVITFSDGYQLYVWDNGQSCCEDRYIHTDDDLTAIVGAQLVGIEVRDAPDRDNGWLGEHEVAFCIVKTSLGDVTIETHNVHNGYYSGFILVARVVAPESDTEE